jgi:hypothetical protein
MVDEWPSGNDFEGSSGGLFEVMSQNLPGGADENTMKPSSGYTVS